MPVITRVFSLSGLHCADCASKIARAVKSLEGVKAAFVDAKGSRLTVDADPRLSSAELISAVSSAGYSAVES